MKWWKVNRQTYNKKQVKIKKKRRTRKSIPVTGSYVFRAYKQSVGCFLIRECVCVCVCRQRKVNGACQREESRERERRHERIESNIGEASEVGLLSGGWVATDEYNRFSVSASFVRVFLPVYLYFLSWMIAWSPLTSQTFHLSLQHISSILSYRRPRLRMSLSLSLFTALRL